MRIPVLLLLALGVAACASPAEADAARRGRAETEADIATGKPGLLTIGLLGPDHSPLDPASGLPRYSVGCVVSGEATARVDAYNGVILAALRDGRLRGMTFEDRVTSREAAAARFAAEGGTVVEMGGPAADSPGGRFRVEVAPRNLMGHMGPYVFVTDTATGERGELIYLGEPRGRVLFDAGGRTLLVRDDRFRTTRTFDLARRLDLQTFPDLRDER